MPHLNDEATPIARLIGPDGKSIVGWVYAWGTSELAILWLEPGERAMFVESEIDAEMLAKAKATTPVDVIDLLGTLQIPAKY